MAKLKKTLPKEFVDYCFEHGNIWTAEDIDKCKEMLEPCEPDARERGTYNYTALHKYIPLELAEWLIDRGADVNAEQTYGTPIFNHARVGDYDICELLIKHGANLNAFDYMEQTPLFAAADGGHADIVKLFLDNGADPKHHEKHFGENIGRTPLLNMLERMRPGDRGKAETAQILIDAQGGKDRIPAREWEMAQGFISDKGRKFEFSKSGMEEEYRKNAENEMMKLYALFDVTPPTPIIRHDGVAKIEIDNTLSFSEQYNKLWEYLVPPSGKCDTVQGEVIRITGRLGNEIYGNGGVNWDKEYHKMLVTLTEYFRQGKPLSEAELKIVENACTCINETKGCGGENEVGKLQEFAVKWIAMNSNPIQLREVPYKR